MKKWIHVLLITFGAVCATLLAISHSSSLYAQTSSGDWGCWITVDESVPVTKCAWDTHDWGNGDYTTLAGDINGDGKADRILYRATDGDWGCWLTSYATKCRWDTQKWGTADYMPLLGDIDGDGRADRILYRAQDGDWGCQLANGEKCNWDAEKWGTIDYVPLIGDVNGDGKVDRILYSPRDGDWGCLLTGKDQSNPEKCNWDTEDWGDASYVPMLGDVNGDGKADRILYRATDGDWGCWFTDVKEPDKQKCNWDTDDWGSADYTPLIGDVNGDGKVDRMLYRPADGDWGCWITDAPDRDRPKCAWDAQDWGNANYVPLVADVDGDGKADRILHESLPTQRVINLSISLYKTAGTEEERAPYVGILKHFADAIYEMSNGRHTLGKVTIFQNGMNSNTADILWVNTEWPHVPGGCISGVGKAGCHINTGDTYPFSTPYNATHAANWQGAGYTLAHEWGHYYYGLFDEYNGSAACNDTPANIFQLQTCDSMPNSVMNNQWHARNNNYNWLNFGVAVNQTRHNVNWRVYGASGWEVLARSPQLDPRDGQRRRSTRLTYFPELASVAPASTSSSPIELPNANSRSHLQIHWIAPPAISHAAVATNSDDYQPMVRLANSNALWYPEAAILVATLAKEGGFIAKSDIMATVAAPDSTIETITFHDDGIAPDLEADDGLYTASWLYTQNGKHLITVHFSNGAGAAQIVYASNHYTPDPTGTGYQPLPQSITEKFDEATTIDVYVNGSPANVNTPQLPTQITLDNRNFPGRIDEAGDQDSFTFTPAQSGEVVVRLTDFAYGMQPHVNVLRDTNELAVLAESQYIPTGDNYFFTKLMVEVQQTYRIEVSHVNPNATDGLYNISVGPPLPNQTEQGNHLYLPLVLH